MGDVGNLQNLFINNTGIERLICLDSIKIGIIFKFTSCSVFYTHFATYIHAQLKNKNCLSVGQYHF